MVLTGSIAYANDIAPADKELLDFIAEFEDTDDDTFELLLFFGKRDAGKTDPASENKPDTEEPDDENT